MNWKILKTGVVINLISIIGFAVSMPFEFDFGSYLFSMFIALSFIIMACGYDLTAHSERKICGNLCIAFGCVYASIILLVYFTQLTTVRNEALPAAAANILDFKKLGLMFNYDLLGYAMMSLSSFFAGLSIVPVNIFEKALKVLLLLNIIFFISCLSVPMLNLFNSSANSDGVIILEFWCAFFSPITILSYNYFMKRINTIQKVL